MAKFEEYQMMQISKSNPRDAMAGDAIAPIFFERLSARDFSSHRTISYRTVTP